MASPVKTEKKYPSIRVFESPFWERLTHVNPITPLLVWAPIIFAFLYKSLVVDELSVFTVLAVGLSAMLFWTLTEYVLHRFVFHFVHWGPKSEKLQFLIHGLHHADPQDPTRLVMPPAGGLILGVILFGIFYSVLGPVWVNPFFAFFLVGYLCYDYTHFYVHHFQPRTVVGKWIKQSHMIHHYVDPNLRWGVSSPLWDWVFGTLRTSTSESALKHGAK